MNVNSLIIVTDERRVGGMLNAARAAGGRVAAAVVGPRPLAEKASAGGFDRVLWLEPAQGVPAEAYAARLAEAAAGVAPGVVLASDVPAGRMLLAAVAAKLDAAVIGAVRALSVDGGRVVVSRFTADDKVLEDLACAGCVAGIFGGEDVDMAPSRPVEIERVDAAGARMRVTGTIEPEGGNGMLTAARVIGVGTGVKAKDDLKLIEELASAAHAEIGCSLPVCEDLRWLALHQVVGSTHNQIAPDLYIAVGISAQPQHMAGIRDARVVVAVNNDPEARIFKFCNYGIVGDLYKVVPALISAFQNAD